MALGISPLVDYAFKALFGNPAHPAVTLHFLNAVLAPPRICEVQIINPFLEQESDGGKLAVLDIQAVDELGRKLNIEVQTTVPAALSKRLLFYAAGMYCRQLAEGEAYAELRPAITICVLQTALFPRLPDLHLDYRLREPGGQVLTDDLQVHLLQLAKAPPLTDNGGERSPLEAWAQFLRHAEELGAGEIRGLFPDRAFAEAVGVLEMISHSPDQRTLYELRQKALRDEAARLAGALEQGIEQGIEQGREEGALAGEVRVLQELLGREVTPLKELAALSRNELFQLSQSLREEWRRRG